MTNTNQTTADVVISKIDARKGEIRLFAGRSVVARIAAETLSIATLEAVVKSLAARLPASQMSIEEAAVDAIELAGQIRGSIVPMDYRLRYGADQNCGDAMAAALTAAVTTTTPEGKPAVDLEACRRIAGDNGIEDKFDRWIAKDLNNGQVRMNLGNVLRGKVRRDEPVTIGGQTFQA